jgi:hypothetical protein
MNAGTRSKRKKTSRKAKCRWEEEMLNDAYKLLFTKYWRWAARNRSDWTKETGEIMARKRVKWEEGDSGDNIVT